MQIQRILFAAALCLGAAATTGGCAWILADNGPVERDTRSLPAFTGVSSSGSFHAIVTVGQAQSVVIEAERDIIPKIRTEVVDGTLEIESQGWFTTNEGIMVHVTVPRLQSAHLQGSGDVVVKGATGPSFDASVSGSGDMSLSGKVDAFQASVSGSGEVHAFELEAATANASVSGSGDLQVYATNTLQATVSGSGEVVYRGDPKVTQTVAGSGEVRRDPG